MQATYSHGEEIDQPLAMTRGGASYFYHTDHLGSVRLLTDAAGAVANAYDYDAFGNLEATSFETVANPYAFTARERDAESGLMFYRARYYDPKIGRFISKDPIELEANDMNFYRYAYNLPIMLNDPSGMSSTEAAGEACFSAVAATAAGVAVGQSVIVGFGYIAAEIGKVNKYIASVNENANKATFQYTVAVIGGGAIGCGTMLATRAFSNYRLWVKQYIGILAGALSAGASLEASGAGIE